MLKWLAAVLALGLGVLLLVHGTGETATREVIRWTARGYLCLLCLALVADGLRGEFFGWRHWADVLRGLALSHGVHLLAIGARAWYTGGRNLLERGAIVILGGGVAYAFILLGALRPRARLVHLGLFWIWGVFLVSYASRAIRMPMPYAVPAALLVAPMLIRLGSRLRQLPIAG